MSHPIERRESLRVAIVHYWLLRMRGGEKVLEALCELYPQADIFTHVYSPKNVSPIIREHAVTQTFIGSLPFAKKLYKHYLPLMPLALEQLDMTEYDLIISSEAGPAKGIIARPDALHVCYCHSPMRYLWDQYPHYRRNARGLTRMMMPMLMSGLRQWDVTSAARVDHFIANSRAVAGRIEKYWRRGAEVISPPVDVDNFTPAQHRDDFYLFVGEMVPYKRADIAIRACTMMERRLIVVGDGPDIKNLRKIAGPTIEFVGHVPFDMLREYYARCRAYLFPAEEDFGIVPVEAMASGAPILAFARGGSRDIVTPDVTGLFFDHQTVPDMISAIVRFEQAEHTFDHRRIAEMARQFHADIFRTRIRSTIDHLLAAKRADLARANDTLRLRQPSDLPPVQVGPRFRPQTHP